MKLFFQDLKLPVLVAEASSGDMGGEYSHEYLLPNAIGEDTVAACDNCGYTANDEVAQARPLSASAVEDAKQDIDVSQFALWRGISQDGMTLVNAWYPKAGKTTQAAGLNTHAVKKVVPELDTSIENPLRYWEHSLSREATTSGEGPRLLNVVDARLWSAFATLREQLPLLPSGLDTASIPESSISTLQAGESLNLLQLADGDGCPKCDKGSLKINRALELAHTFYLGTRYSVPLEANVSLPENPAKPVPIEMGCYGIGVSRILGAIAEHMSDKDGLMWPRAIAPFDVVVIPTSGVADETFGVYDSLASQGPCDVVLDDRKVSFGWKMRDADATGYPVTVVLGKAWREKGMCEVQCRKLSLKKEVLAEELPVYVQSILAQL